MRKRDWEGMISDHTQYFYEQSVHFMRAVAEKWTPFSDSRYAEMEGLLNVQYLSGTIGGSCAGLGLKSCIVHGNLAARNV